MKIIYLGTPDFAVKPLEAILKANRHQVLAVITQPDRPVGRKAIITPSPVKVFANTNNITVLQYEKVSLEGIEEIKKLNPDIMVTCAYGQILSKEFLDIAKHGVINIHASLLPKYRGAAPIQFAILNGETETGVTIIQTEVSLDSGAIIDVEKTKIEENENSVELFEKLSQIGANLIVKALDNIEDGKATFTPQNESEVTKCKQIKSNFALIDWTKSATEIHNLIRSMYDWPCAYTNLNNSVLQIYKSKIVKNLEDFNLPEKANFECGEVVVCDIKKGLVVAAKNGYILIEQLQLTGGKIMSSKDFINGRKIIKGDILK